MWGFNAYWDYRQGTLASWFQMGAGFELLGKTCDLRINGDVPLEGKRTKSHTFVVDEEEGLFTRRTKFEYPYTGFNAELGWKAVRKRNFQLYLAGGTYYLTGSCKNSWGGSFRVRPQYRDYLAVDLSMSQDSIFKLIYQIQVIFSLPLYRTPANRKPPCNIYGREIYRLVERFDLINLGRGSCWKSNF